MSVAKIKRTNTIHERFLNTNKKQLTEETAARLALTTDIKTAGRTVKGGNQQLNSSGYFAQDNVKQYQEEMLTHLFSEQGIKKMGRGTFFTDEVSMGKYIIEYFHIAMDANVVPTISALCTYLHIDRQTLLNYANNQNSPYYNVARSAVDYCHSCLETGASESKLNSVAYIFQGKNYFGMKDTTDVNVNALSNQQVNSTETLNALQEQKDKEASLQRPQIEIREAEIVDEKINS